jgi:hypothetical protein
LITQHILTFHQAKLLTLFSQLSLSSIKILRIKVMHADKVIRPSHRSTFSMRHKRSLGWEVGNAEQWSHRWPAPHLLIAGVGDPEPGCCPKRCSALSREQSHWQNSASCASQRAKPTQPKRIMHSGIFYPIEEHLKILSLPSRVWTSSHTSRWQ